MIDGEDAHDGAPRARDDHVGEVPLGGDEDVAWELADRDLVWRFLELENLRVDELRLFVNYKVRIHWAFGLIIPSGARVAARPGQSDSGYPAGHVDGVDMSAIAAFDKQRRRLG